MDEFGNIREQPAESSVDEEESGKELASLDASSNQPKKKRKKKKKNKKGKYIGW